LNVAKINAVKRDDLVLGKVVVDEVVGKASEQEDAVLMNRGPLLVFGLVVQDPAIRHVLGIGDDHVTAITHGIVVQFLDGLHIDQRGSGHVLQERLGRLVAQEKVYHDLAVAVLKVVLVQSSERVHAIRHRSRARALARACKVALERTRARITPILLHFRKKNKTKIFLLADLVAIVGPNVVEDRVKLAVKFDALARIGLHTHFRQHHVDHLAGQGRLDDVGTIQTVHAVDTERALLFNEAEHLQFARSHCQRAILV